MTAQMALDLGNQRWVEGRASYRPPQERINPTEYDVVEIQGDRTARAFVELHHYSASYPAARVRIGLHRHGSLVGVAVFSQPCNNLVLTNTFHGVPMQDGIELGRFVLLDEVPGNGETWFLARCFDLLRRQGIQGVLSMSDPTPRTAIDGRVVFPGHLGTIYQAHNARYLGLGTSRTLKVLPDGTVFSARTLQKIRAGERGWHGGVDALVGFGAGPLDREADRGERMSWLASWLPRLTRSLRHPGNHRYAWALTRRCQLSADGFKRYPKAVAA